MTADAVIVGQMRRMYDFDQRRQRREVQRKLAIKILARVAILTPRGAMRLAADEMRSRGHG